MNRRRARGRSSTRVLIVLVVILLGAVAWSRVTSPNTPTSSPATQASPADLALIPPGEGQISLDRNFYIVFDASGSMLESGCAGRFNNRLEGAKWAVKEFMRQGVPADVNLGLYVFDSGGANERVALGKDNREQIASQVDAIRGGGETPLDGAVKAGVTKLATQRTRELGYGVFNLVVATDGEATDVAEARNAVQFAGQQAIPIVTIGFCLKQNHALAAASISYRSADNPQALLAALQETQGESPYFDSSVFQRR